MAKEMSFMLQLSRVYSLKNCPQKSARFQRITIAVGNKDYQIDIRELSTDLKLDSCCRDFTVNAIYLDLQKGCLIDYACGIVDLQSRLLRGCAAAKIVFLDKARIIRLYRLEQELGFAIEDDLLQESSCAESLTDFDRKGAVANEFNKILENGRLRLRILGRLIEKNLLPFILECFVTLKDVRLQAACFEQDCKRLARWLLESEQDLESISCPVYGSAIDSTMVLKLMVGFFMLCSIQRRADWQVADFEVPALHIIKKLFHSTTLEVWLQKTFLLMMVCVRDDNRISHLSFNDQILSQLPLKLIMAMQTSSNLGEKAGAIIKSAAAAYKCRFGVLPK